MPFIFHCFSLRGQPFVDRRHMAQSDSFVRSTCPPHHHPSFWPSDTCHILAFPHFISQVQLCIAKLRRPQDAPRGGILCLPQICPLFPSPKSAGPACHVAQSRTPASLYSRADSVYGRASSADLRHLSTSRRPFETAHLAPPRHRPGLHAMCHNSACPQRITPAHLAFAGMQTPFISATWRHLRLRRPFPSAMPAGPALPVGNFSHARII